MPETNAKKQRFIELLHELFQLDQPELDFGFYKIMHAKSEQIQRFINEELSEHIDAAFAGQGNQSAEDKLAEARQAIIDNIGENAFEQGELKPEYQDTPAGKRFLAAQQALREGGELSDDAEVYDHLYRFFARYYDQGDFLSTRYRQAPSDTRDTPYSVPYDGREVYLHWANKDQYYIKSSETLRDYRFELNAAVQQARTNSSSAMPGWKAPEQPETPRHVQFRIVDAAEVAHGNVKEKEQRFFLIHAAEPIRLDNNELTIQFEYRPDPDKTGQNKKWQEKRLAEAETAVFEALDVQGDDDAATFKQALRTPAPTDKNADRSLLAKHFAKYTARHTMDYFIHKDLGGFLRRELDFYIKNELMRLDHIESAEAPEVTDYLDKVKVIRQIARRIITFLAQLEEFQKKLWLKKKFVTETNYCITLDRIPEEFYPEIAANKKQIDEWRWCYSIDDFSSYSEPLTREFLNSNPYLMIDTSFFDGHFKHRLISATEQIDKQCQGLLVHSENSHALSLINEKTQHRVKGIYIDPPYNTGDDGFPYKDSYKHSSWMTMLHDRIAASKNLLKQEGLFFSSIDRDENRNYLPLLFSIFSDEGFIEECVWQKAYGGGFKTKHINNIHEYVHIFANDKLDVPRLEQPPSRKTIKYYKYKDEQFERRGKYRLQPLNTNSNDYRANLTFPLPMPDLELLGTKKWGQERARIRTLLDNNSLWLEDNGPNVTQRWRFRIGAGYWDGGLIFPPRQWQWSWDKVREALINDAIVVDYIDGDWSINYKQYRYDENGEERGSKPPSLVVGPYTQAGTEELRSLFNADIAKFIKPSGLIEKFLSIDYHDSNALFLDYFAGTGSTGHAVINLNRREGGDRKYILIEQGDYFDSALMPRLQKVVCSTDWKDGKPQSDTEGNFNGVSHCIKYIRLESYEDALNNLELREDPDRDAALEKNDELRHDYYLRYWLDTETRGSQSLLNIQQFRDPTDYRMHIKQPGSDEVREQPVDLVETFNWLIGLHVELLDKPRIFAAAFERETDPDLPDGAPTRLKVKGRLKERDDGTHWFRTVEGWVARTPGATEDVDKVLVIWRKLTDDPEQDSAALESLLTNQLRINQRDTEFDVIYINGPHGLSTDFEGKYRLHSLEEAFHAAMWTDD